MPGGMEGHILIDAAEGSNLLEVVVTFWLEYTGNTRLPFRSGSYFFMRRRGISSSGTLTGTSVFMRLVTIHSPDFITFPSVF